MWTSIRLCWREQKIIDVDVFKDKIDNISKKVKDDKNVQNIINYMYFILGSEKTIEIPVGIQHGDLTFSNMIFSNKIVLIDFLDSYIESPLQDIGKIFQEINLKWSVLMSGKISDNAKVNIGYDYLRHKTRILVEELMKEFDICEKTMAIFYLMTLLRLFPYITKPEIYDVTLKECKKCMSGKKEYEGRIISSY